MLIILIMDISISNSPDTLLLTKEVWTTCCMYICWHAYDRILNIILRPIRAENGRDARKCIQSFFIDRLLYKDYQRASACQTNRSLWLKVIKIHANINNNIFFVIYWSSTRAVGRPTFILSWYPLLHISASTYRSVRRHDRPTLILNLLN